MKDAVIKQNMTKGLVTIKWDKNMQDAAEIMEEQRIRHLPVVDELGVIVGILSDRDINLAKSPKNPGFITNSVVSEYMNWPVVTIDQNLSIKEAAQGMIDEKISAFLVTDQNKTVVGIITSEDLLKVLVRLLSEPSVISKLSYSPVVGELIRDAQSLGI